MKNLTLLSLIIASCFIHNSTASATCKLSKAGKSKATLTCSGKNTISCSSKALKVNSKSIGSSCPLTTLTVTGSTGADKLTLKGGLAQTLKVNGKAGNDTIDLSHVSASSSSKTSDLEDPTITINGGPGDDTITGSPFDDSIDGEAGDDEISAGDGDDDIDGGDGDDTLSGDDGDDSCDGEDGEDDMWGGDGDDFFDGGPGDDNEHHFPGDNDQFDNSDGGDDHISDDDHF